MHRPPAFAVDDRDLIRAMLDRAPLALLITQGEAGMVATHMPLFLDAEGRTLRGHVARGNPQQHTGGEALVIFTGPNAYVSPSWYASKAEHGKVVPTWNYEAVHVYGALRWTSDAAFLKDTVRALTDRFEAGPHPWSIDDAPDGYIDGAVTRITGVEIAITRIEAVRKLSQNRGEADRTGVIDGLLETGNAGSTAIAKLMSELKD